MMNSSFQTKTRVCLHLNTFNKTFKLLFINICVYLKFHEDYLRKCREKRISPNIQLVAALSHVSIETLEIGSIFDKIV